jgi:transcriptional regulator with XRE-family HTH domain
MSERHDKPSPLDAALAAQIHAARIRGAYSIETLAAVAQVTPEVIARLEQGAPIADAGARDRVMDVLGLRPDSQFSPAKPIDYSRRALE